MMNRVLFLAVTLFCLACGDNDRPQTIDPLPNGGAPARAGRGGMTSEAGEAGADAGGTGGTGGSGGATAQAPQVVIKSPVAVDDPTEGEVLVDDRVTVVCEVTASEQPGASPVDPSTVKIELIDANGDVVESATARASAAPREYEASFPLTPELHGPLAFRCSAEDRSTRPAQGSAEISTFFDAGPLIVAGTPEPDSARAITGAIPISFRVEPRPLSDADDAAAAVDSVVLTVGGVEIDVVESEDSAGTYVGSVNLEDATLFPNRPIDDVQVSVFAMNRRAPTPVESVLSYSFNLDSRGPEISIQSPAEDHIVGGEVQLEFRVTDQSGVDLETLVVQVNDIPFPYDSAQDSVWKTEPSSGRVTFVFDTTDRRFFSRWQLTLNIRVEDEVGNASIASTNFFLDNQAPFVHLDPAPVREYSRRGECSLPFDPLGFAPNDGDQVEEAVRFRALVWDRTNTVSGDPILYFATTDPESVVLHMQTVRGAPILTDADRDGTCDAIVTTPEPKHEKLNPIGNGGTAVRGPTALGALGCEYPTSNNTGANPLSTLCNNASELYRVIDHSLQGPEPVVYATGDDLSSVACTGTYWEIGALLRENGERWEGWVCLAAEAEDEVGNRGVSPPLRVCFSDGVGSEPPCANASTLDMPDCTDDCSVPADRAPFELDDDGSFGVRLEE